MPVFEPVCDSVSRSVRDTVMHVSIVTGWPLEKGQFIWKRKRETMRSHTILTGDIHRSTADDKIRLCWPLFMHLWKEGVIWALVCHHATYVSLLPCLLLHDLLQCLCPHSACTQDRATVTNLPAETGLTCCHEMVRWRVRQRVISVSIFIFFWSCGHIIV